MADLDVLVRPYRYVIIQETMGKLGYSGGNESTSKHDSFIKDKVKIEMHKRLTDESGVIRHWENRMWERALPASEKGILRMTPEDAYIFHFVHLHHHFLNGSLGLRRIIDTWLLQKQSIDMTKVQPVLERFGMWTFHNRVVRLSLAAMGQETMDDASEFLLSHAFMYGIYGTDKSYKAGRIAAMGNSLKSGKRWSALAAVFLPYKRMKAQFPQLEKWPVLLPWYWIKRIMRLLKRGMKKNRKRLDYSNVSEADYAEMKKFFESGGV